MAHGQAGYGKMKVDNCKVLEDLASVMAMGTHYCTAEPFLSGLCVPTLHAGLSMGCVR